MTTTMQTSARELLQTLVECERYRDQFSRGLPVSGCLRRQVERQRGAKVGTLGPPKRPACVVCAKGIEIATIAASVGVQARPCPTCGGALIGDVACEVCMDSKAPAKGFLPPPGAPLSTRIWNGEVPDVPIGGPSPNQGPRQSAPDLGTLAPTRRAPADRTRAALERVREAAPRVAPEAVNQEPARPAEEETMASEKGLGQICSNGCGRVLRSDNRTGVCAKCQAGYALPKGAKVEAAKPKASAKRAATPRKTLAPAAEHVGLENMTAPELLSLVDLAQAELRRRRDDARAIDKEITAALGEAA